MWHKTRLLFIGHRRRRSNSEEKVQPSRMRLSEILLRRKSHSALLLSGKSTSHSHLDQYKWTHSYKSFRVRGSLYPPVTKEPSVVFPPTEDNSWWIVHVSFSLIHKTSTKNKCHYCLLFRHCSLLHMFFYQLTKQQLWAALSGRWKS